MFQGSKTFLSKNLSLVTLVALCVALGSYRLGNVHEKEISWDILGYYLYLPATFVHHDPLLTDIGWLQEVNTEKQLTGTLYQVSWHNDHNPMYFFLMGMALFYLPFFLAAHALAGLLGFPADGFSPPYHYALAIGGIVYMVIGLVFFRKILRHFFSERITAAVIFIVTLGTNYIHHLTIQNIEPVTVLFMLAAITTWYTIRWHNGHRPGHLVITGTAVALMALVKPSEIVIALVPLLWNATPREMLREKFHWLKKQWAAVLLTAFIVLLLALPQMLYWYLETGKAIVDSYVNPGVGLDLRSPHIADTLFSYRKGWLLYTPVMVFALIGLWVVFRYRRGIFFALAAYVAVEFYIIASWSEWWYGAGFSIRPMITTYPLLGIALGYFLQFLSAQKRWISIPVSMVILCLVVFNQFQWWQFKRYIIHPYRTSKEYYHANFLKTRFDKTTENLLLVNRDFSGHTRFGDEEYYTAHTLVELDFAQTPGGVHHLAAGEEYTLQYKYPFESLSVRDHVWVRVSLDIRVHPGYTAPAPHVVATVERPEGSYGYYAPEIPLDTTGGWSSYRMDYLTPEMRQRSDHVMIYFWNRGKETLDIDNFRIEVFERKMGEENR